MKRVLLIFGLAAGLAVAPLVLAQSKAKPKPPRECGCSDLPAMISELNEQEFMQNLFQGWVDYFPASIRTNSELKQRAEAALNAAFYAQNGGSAAGTTHGGHAHMGTDVLDPNCPVVVYLYDKKGQAVLDSSGEQKTKAVSEQTYQGTECAGIRRYLFAHEAAHVETCKRVPTKSWESPYFFARDDAAAYKAGAEVLRQELEPLLSACGWRTSTQNRLPNVEEAQKLAKRAAKARPSRRKK